MLPEEIPKLNISLGQFLRTFKECFQTSPAFSHLRTYIQGQVSDLDRKNVEQIAVRTQTHVRTLQDFLGTLEWDEDQMIQNLQKYVSRKHTGEQNIGVLDSSYFSKQGDKTAGVKRQWNGEKGKVDNCVVSVNLSYCSDSFYTLIDSEIYLPKEWIQDQQRREEAEIPEHITYRSKQEIALDQVQQARKEMSFHWITFDAGFGKSPQFIEGLEEINQPYIGEVKESTTGWTERPEMIHSPESWSKRGRKPDFPTVHPDADTARSVQEIIFEDPVCTNQDWEPYYIKETTKGPLIWEAKFVPFYHSRDGVPSKQRLLIGARQPFTEEVKYFVVYNPTDADLTTVLEVAFTRYSIEFCFRESKQMVGLDEFEVRKYRSIIRHMIISMLSHLFISEQTDKLKKDYPHITKPQVKLATETMIAGWKLTPKRRKQKYKWVCKEIRRRQNRNKQSYKSHRKTRREKLKQEGYDLDEIRSCVQKLE